MANIDKMSRETMIVRHVPLVHGQSVGCHVYPPSSKPTRPSSLSLTHSISLPEKENLPNEALNGSFQGRAIKSNSNEKAGISDPGSGYTRGYSSTTFHCCNQFVFKSDSDENCDAYVKNLQRYCKGQSFSQNGNSNETKNKPLRCATKSLYCTQCTVSTTTCKHNKTILEHFGTVGSDKQVLSDLGVQLQRDIEDAPTFMDCKDQKSADEKDCRGYAPKMETLEEPECYNYVPNMYNAFLNCESYNQNQTDYISDSSCNSSDGVLVNFSAIYNKTNNAVPATPYGLDSPPKPSRESGSMHQDDDFKLIPCWSLHEVDPNCNIYQTDCNGLLSQEISDLTPCQGELTAYTNNYYKLVSCELSSQSAASPAWSPLTSCSEGHSHGSMTPPTEYFLFGKEDRKVAEVNQLNHQDDEDTDKKGSKRNRKIQREINKEKTCSKIHPDKDPEPNNHEQTSALQISQSWKNKLCHSLSKQEGLRRVLSCPSQISPSSHVLKQHKTSFAELARHKNTESSLSVVKNSKEDPTCFHFLQNSSTVYRKDNLGQNVTLITNKTEKESGRSMGSKTGVTESDLEMAHYTKPQRPTSLPIQPFVLQPPSEKQSNKALGSLINQYQSHKHGASENTDLSGCLALSPLDNYSSIHLEVASCSETCSTCTPTPTEFFIRPHWVPPSLLFFQVPQVFKYRSTKTKEHDKSLTGDKASPNLKQCATGQEKPSHKPFPNKKLQSFFPAQADSHLTPDKCQVPEPRTQGEHFFPHYSLSPAITSVTLLTSDTSNVLPGTGRCNSDAVYRAHTNEEHSTGAFYILEPKKLSCLLVKEQHQHGDSSSLADRPPEEFCSSPDVFMKSLPIDLLQSKDMLKSLSKAVDLITAHFSSGTDPNEKFRVGNSSLCPKISQLVLDHLCPAFRNILQDGLRPFKLDLIVGQRSNKPWSVVEASTKPGPSTRMLHSLVSVVKKCSKLTNHSMRLNAFFLGLLNLSALENWFWHLHTCIDVIAEYYHPWAFLALSQDPAFKSHFQELLLLLQPLSELPFDLHLLSESRLQKRQEQNQLSVQQSSFFALSGFSFLQPHDSQNSDGHHERANLEKRQPCTPSQTEMSTSCITTVHKSLQGRAVMVSGKSNRDQEQKQVSVVCSEKKHAGWWLSHTPITEHVMEAHWPDAVPHRSNNKTLVENVDSSGEEFSLRTDEVQMAKELRWARLFGSGITMGVEKTQHGIKPNQRMRTPSQWLHLGASKVDQLAQSMCSRETLCQLQQWCKLKH
ncbi:uncharacterized protein LOC124393884 [Silurus meridionalis]|uniref:RUN domain-containing protein n=1 Tax=Silurus meridionalis TaxID=175797 RepID=A0A8T0B7T0_SILME|nr:uncharacterized protein LOC124393884 [Silurus meridionalis]XP_046717886.1 uncharacterized protein LOC124393884 [Silurus meridionalis]KAF7700816.1 hypothetical protein HF521_001981 [Silurus meridionalis]